MTTKGPTAAAHMNNESVRTQLAALGSPAKAKRSAGFFKTGKGQYAEGDVFLGVPLPAQRLVARAHRDLPLSELSLLLQSTVHEERSTALLILVMQYQLGAAAQKEQCFAFYRSHLAHVNNWDLVDGSAHQLLGAHLLTRDRRLLVRLARSKSVWERRIAMVATYAFIRAGEWKDTLRLAELLLEDEHDLMHKAVGWMLREVGKRVDVSILRRFLTQHSARMPRTALRYAIERLPDRERRAWLAR